MAKQLKEVEIQQLSWLGCYESEKTLLNYDLRFKYTVLTNPCNAQKNVYTAKRQQRGTKVLDMFMQKKLQFHKMMLLLILTFTDGNFTKCINIIFTNINLNAMRLRLFRTILHHPEVNILASMPVLYMCPLPTGG